MRTARWLIFGIGRRRLGHRPAGQHAVAFQPDVVVQSARMVFLDDESEAVCLLIWRPRGHWLRRLGRIAHAAIAGEPIPIGAGRQWREWVTKSRPDS